MSDTYFHTEETVLRTSARRCYELVAAIRRYGQWWQRVQFEPLGPEATLRIGSCYRFTGEQLSGTVQITAMRPWRRVDLRCIAGDLLGPVSWEFIQRGNLTLVRYAYRGIEPNSESLRRAFAGGRGLEVHSDMLQTDAFVGMRRVLENAFDVSGGDLFEALHTLRSVRSFRPDALPASVLHAIIEAATHAPSARNAQPWYFLAVRDPDVKRTIAALYLGAWQQAQRYTSEVDADADIKDRPGYRRMMRRVDALATHLDSAPVIVLALLDTTQLGPMADGQGTILAPQSAYASIFPAVENLMLAARGLGVGSTLTTVFSSVEAELRATVGIPPHVHIAALVPLGYPRQPFRATKRKPVGEVAFLDRWGQKLSAD
jgi:nitroreductase